MANAKALADSPTFMMVSGISSSEEMCLTAANGDGGTDGAGVVLESCAAAIAAGDGRELWQHLPNGEIASTVGKKCVGATDDDAVTLTACDGGAVWEAQGSGQWKLDRAGNYCLSQQGAAAGVEDAAERGAITASSTADAAAHGANMAVDGSSSTFWASGMDPTGPVMVTVDLGHQRKLSSVDLQWEFPAKSFAISVSTDGVKWSEVYATDSNVLSSSSVPLGSVSASRLRVAMHKAAGSFHGHAVYGIRKLAVRAPRLQSIVEACASAAKSNDARDKYFAAYVGEFASCSSKALRSELPSLEAARASVASITSELAEVLPKLSSCGGAAGFMKSKGSSMSLGVTSHVDEQTDSDNAAQITQSVDSQNGIDTNAVEALLKAARRVIITARGHLF